MLTNLINFCCTVGKRTTIPIRSIQLVAAEQRPARTMLVLLPGRGSQPEQFEKYGFVEMLRQRGPGCEVVAVDAHLRYFLEKSLIDRLREDILRPARQAGVEKIWLAGISMGALGSLATAMDHPDLVDGVVLLSPFMGPDVVIDELERAGGLMAWQAPTTEDPEEFNVFARDLWTWLKANAASSAPMPLVLVHGTREGYLLRGFSLLAEAIPAESRFAVEGKHNWKSWQRMWQQLVDRGYLDFCR